MADLDPIYQNLPASYTCDNCGNVVEPSKHCGHPMHLEEIEGTVMWICWMGKSCGFKDYTACCDNPSIPIHKTVNL